MKLVDRLFEPLRRVLWVIDDSLDVRDPLFEDTPSTWPGVADH